VNNLTHRTLDAEDLRNHTTIPWRADGQQIPESYRDLRGTPAGATADEWTFDRLVTRRGSARRVRQQVKIRYCAEGWHSTSGGADAPMGLQVCGSLLNHEWRNSHGGLDRERFNTFHDDHPVVWIVETRVNSDRSQQMYCDAELPAAWREVVSAVTSA
jgi:hypothetical protein